MKKQTNVLLPFLIPMLRTVLFIAVGLLMLALPPFKGKTLEEISRWWSFVAIVVNVITIVVLYLLAKREGIKYRDLLFHSKSSKVSVKTVLIAIALMLPLGFAGLWGFSYLFYGYMPVTMIQPLPVWAAVVSLVFLPISIVFAEMPLYIGYSIPRIQTVTGSKALAYVYPLFFYALQHSFMPLIFETNHIISRFFIFIPLLIMVALWNNRKKDLVPLMIGHGILDLGVSIQILVISISPGIFDMMNNAAG